MTDAGLKAIEERAQRLSGEYVPGSLKYDLNALIAEVRRLQTELIHAGDNVDAVENALCEQREENARLREALSDQKSPLRAGGEAMTDAELKAIEERVAAATPGEWIGFAGVIQYIAPEDCTPERKAQRDVKKKHLVGVTGPECKTAQESANSKFIAHARIDIPALIAEVKLQWECLGVAHRINQDKLREYAAENARLREALQGLRTGGCFCPVGIGDPRLSDHLPCCKKATAVLNSLPS